MRKNQVLTSGCGDCPPAGGRAQDLSPVPIFRWSAGSLAAPRTGGTWTAWDEVPCGASSPSLAGDSADTDLRGRKGQRALPGRCWP